MIVKTADHPWQIGGNDLHHSCPMQSMVADFFCEWAIAQRSFYFKTQMHEIISKTMSNHCPSEQIFPTIPVVRV